MHRFVDKNRYFVFLLIVLVSLTGCTIKTTAEPGVQALEYLNALDQNGARVAGTDMEIKAANWAEIQFKEMGYTVTRMPFDYDDGGTKQSENLIVEKKGDGTGTIIVGAHYDSVDAANGVDDNGSGVAVVLEAAKALENAKTPQTIKFILFGAEEVDILGSKYYVDQMTAKEKADTLLMINLDSIVAGEIAYVYGSADENGKFRERTLDLAKELNLTLVTQDGLNPDYPIGTTGDWGDHASFNSQGIPFINFESTNWSLGEMDGYTQVAVSLGDSGEIWHTQYDTYAYIEKTFPGRIQERLTLFSTVLQKLLQEDLSKL